MTRIAGCDVDRIERRACEAWLDCVTGRGPVPLSLGEDAWALCHCDDGVTWGRLADGTWRLASQVFPGISPVPSAITLQEMRVFSRVAEALIWRTEDGLRGRVLRDVPSAVRDGPLMPHDEQRLLLAGRVGEHRDGFTRVGDGTGAEQVLPLPVVEGVLPLWPRLHVRHYFTCDEHTGRVRVAATRLVEVTGCLAT